MLFDPAGDQFFGFFLSLLTLKNTDRSDSVIPGVQNLIRHESGRLTEERPKPSLHVPCRLANPTLTRIDRVLSYSCIHSLSLSQFKTSHLEKTYDS